MSCDTFFLLVDGFEHKSEERLSSSSEDIALYLLRMVIASICLTIKLSKMKFHSFLPIAVDGFLTGSIQILSFQLKIKPLDGFFWIRLNSIQIQTFSVKFFSASCRSLIFKKMFLRCLFISVQLDLD